MIYFNNRNTQSPEEESRSSSSRNSIDVQLWSLQCDSSDSRFKHVFILTSIAAHVCGRACAKTFLKSHSYSSSVLVQASDASDMSECRTSCCGGRTQIYSMWLSLCLVDFLYRHSLELFYFISPPISKPMTGLFSIKPCEVTA